MSYSSQFNREKLNFERGRNDVRQYVRGVFPFPAVFNPYMTKDERENMDMIITIEKMVGDKVSRRTDEGNQRRRQQASTMFLKSNCVVPESGKSVADCLPEGSDDAIARGIGRIVGIWDYHEVASVLLTLRESEIPGVPAMKVLNVREYLSVVMDEGTYVLEPDHNVRRPYLRATEDMVRLARNQVDIGEPEFNYLAPVKMEFREMMPQRPYEKSIKASLIQGRLDVFRFMAKVLHHSPDIQNITDPDEALRAQLTQALIPVVRDAESRLEKITMSVYGRIGSDPVEEKSRRLDFRNRGREICLEKFNNAAVLIGANAFPLYQPNLDYLKEAIAFFEKSALGVYKMNDNSLHIADVENAYEAFKRIAGDAPKLHESAPRSPRIG